eukprot:3941513-Rhodomonas_salina.1
MRGSSRWWKSWPEPQKRSEYRIGKMDREEAAGSGKQIEEMDWKKAGGETWQSSATLGGGALPSMSSASLGEAAGRNMHTKDRHAHTRIDKRKRTQTQAHTNTSTHTHRQMSILGQMHAHRGGRRGARIARVQETLAGQRKRKRTQRNHPHPHPHTHTPASIHPYTHSLKHPALTSTYHHTQHPLANTTHTLRQSKRPQTKHPRRSNRRSGTQHTGRTAVAGDEAIELIRERVENPGALQPPVTLRRASVTPRTNRQRAAHRAANRDANQRTAHPKGQRSTPRVAQHSKRPLVSKGRQCRVRDSRAGSRAEREPFQDIPPCKVRRVDCAQDLRRRHMA